MKCPLCPAETRVIETRERLGYVYRIRACLMGHRTRTKEYVEAFAECKSTRGKRLTSVR